MTKEELVEAAKLRVRKLSTDVLDGDIRRLVDAALANLKRIGVNEEKYLVKPEDPLIVESVLDYVKAKYSVGADFERLIGIYNMDLANIKGGDYK